MSCIWNMKTYIVTIVYSTIHKHTFNTLRTTFIYICEPLLVSHIFLYTFDDLLYFDHWFPAVLWPWEKEFLFFVFLQVVVTSLGCNASSNPKSKIKEMCFTSWVRRCYRNFQFQKDVVPMYKSQKYVVPTFDCLIMDFATSWSVWKHLSHFSWTSFCGLKGQGAGHQQIQHKYKSLKINLIFNKALGGHVLVFGAQQIIAPGYQEAAPMLAGMGLPTQSHDADPTFKWLEGEKRVRKNVCFLFDPLA